MQRFCCLCSHRTQALPCLNSDRSSSAEITTLQIKLSAPALCWGLPLLCWGCRMESMSMLQELFSQSETYKVLLKVDLCWYWTEVWSTDTLLMQLLMAVRKQPAREDWGRGGMSGKFLYQSWSARTLRKPHVTKKCDRSACWACIMAPSNLYL